MNFFTVTLRAIALVVVSSLAFWLAVEAFGEAPVKSAGEGCAGSSLKVCVFTIF